PLHTALACPATRMPLHSFPTRRSSDLIEKLEKFMSGKPVAEQEIGHALLQDMVAYAETSMSRRMYILHYFGEEFDPVTGEGASMDDNVRYPKKKREAMDDVVKLLKVRSEEHTSELQSRENL